MNKEENAYDVLQEHLHQNHAVQPPNPEQLLMAAIPEEASAVTSDNDSSDGLFTKVLKQVS
jgi:hypothetical protein